jgi:diphthamide biosynthesis protein 3
MDLDEDTGVYSYQCPCGDRFVINLDDLCNGEEIAYCPSCTLKIRVLYDPQDFLSSDEEGYDK